MHALLLDNFDSFTYMLKDYIEQCGITCTVLRNNQITADEFLQNKYTHLVISPGPKTPETAGNLMQILNVAVGKMPILGICLGHQAIGLQFGATLQKAMLPRHGKVDAITHYNHAMFNQVSTKFFATRYHSLILKNLPILLEPTATCNAELMALAHKELPIWGIQFHPESCLTKDGLTLIKNFFTQTKNICA